LAPRPQVWESVFHVGTAVVWGIRLAHVVSLPPYQVPEGCVPVMCDNESRVVRLVETQNLRVRFPEQETGPMHSESSVFLDVNPYFRVSDQIG